MEILAMAKSTKRKRKRTTTSSGSKRIRAIIAFLKNERVHFITGILVAFLGIFTLLSIISFFFTGAADQSKVLNRSFLELIQDKQLEVENWASTGGAFLSEILVNRWFGIFSILIPFFVIYLGLRMMKVSSFSFIKALLITAFGMICGSITSAFILGHLFPRSHINWGGAHGSQIEQLLENSIGVPGMILLVLLFILIVVILFRQSSMHRIQETLINSKTTFLRSYLPFPEPEMENIRAAAELINQAERPFALVGQGVILGNAEQELLAFLEKGGIPFGSTILGLSAIPTDHPLNTGMLGMHGN